MINLPPSFVSSLERWKEIARKATRRADRLDLALHYVDQNDPQIADAALWWADQQLALANVPDKKPDHE